MATSRFVQFTDKEMNEIKINSILKKHERPNKICINIFSRYTFHFQYK